jgi:putative component of membrane protein insertase Oxa1/YidC/SpoIIIJ protein YidD
MFITAFTTACHRPLSWELNPLHGPPPPNNIPNVHSDPILPSTLRSSEWSLSFGLSHQNLLHFSLLSHSCHMSRPPHPPRLELSSDVWRWVQTMKVLIVQLPPFSCYFIPLTSKYSPQNSVLKHPHSLRSWITVIKIIFCNRRVGSLEIVITELWTTINRC